MTVVSPDARRQTEDLRDRRAVARDRVNRLQAIIKNTSIAAGTRADAELALEGAQAELSGIDHKMRELVGGMGDAVSSNGNGLDPELGVSGLDARAALTAQLRHNAEVLHEVAVGTGELHRQQFAKLSPQQTVAWLRGCDRPQAITDPPSGGQLGPFAQILPLLQAAPRLVTLFPSGTVDKPMVPFAARIAVEGGSKPGPVALGAIKPVLDLEYDDRTATSATIAGWTKVQRQSLSDDGQFSSRLQSDLQSEVRLAFGREVANGDGSISDVTGQDGIVGLLSTEGVLPADVSGDANTLEKLISGLRDVSLTGAQPSFVAISPVDLAAALKLKSDGSGEYQFAAALAILRSIWSNVAIVTTPELTDGTALVGDSSQGQILIREGVRLYMGTDQDDTIRNRITCLSELRAMFLCLAPAAFRSVDLSTS